MEGLVGGLHRLGEVVVHAAAGDRTADRVGRSIVASVARRDEEHPLGPRMQ